jgi:hypothetical protein
MTDLKREKAAWRVMRRRCLEVRFKDYARYGGAGIKICPQWDSFARFIQDVGPAPSPEHWLGRRDTAGNYTPENVVWTLCDAQQRRRQFCRLVTLDDAVMTAAEVARLPGMPTRESVLRRLASGFSLKEPKLAKLYRKSIWLTHQGECLPLPEWSRRIGLPHSLVCQRVRAGMPVDRILTPHRLQSYRPHHPKPTEKETPCPKPLPTLTQP